jgi:chemotaxis protein CheX
MATATASAPSTMPVNSDLLAAAAVAAESAFSMCGITTRCVGASAVPIRDSGTITGLIGVHGKVSGFVSVNLPERAAVHAVSSLLGEKFTELNAQVVDGVGEIANMITGGVKSALAGSQWAFSQITVPSVIVGRGYSIAYAKGLTFISVTFEHDDSEAMLLEDRLIQVHISLLTL